MARLCVTAVTAGKGGMAWQMGYASWRLGGLSGRYIVVWDLKLGGTLELWGIWPVGCLI